MDFGKLSLGVLILALGVVFLGNNLGIIDRDIWTLIADYWPVLVIFFGLSMILGGRQKNSFRSFWLIIPLAIIAAIIFISMPTNRDQATHDLSVDRFDMAEKAEIRITAGPLKLNLSDSSDSRLVTGKMTTISEPKISNFIEGQTQVYQVEETIDWKKLNFQQNENRYDLRINRELPLSVTINTGASDFVLDMRGLKTEAIDINSGATKGEINLGGKSDNQKIKISAGASDFKIRIPKTSGIRINTDSGLSDDNFGSAGIDRTTDHNYQTENYIDALEKVEIELHLGVSKIEIERY
jgi:hypothetical protein